MHSYPVSVEQPNYLISDTSYFSKTQTSLGKQVPTHTQFYIFSVYVEDNKCEGENSEHKDKHTVAVVPCDKGCFKICSISESFPLEKSHTNSNLKITT